MRLYRIIISIVISCLSVLSSSARTIEGTSHILRSPDGNYVFSFFQDDNNGKRQMYYSVIYKGYNIIRQSKLGVDIQNHLFESALGVPNDTCTNWGDNLMYIGADTLSHNATWKPLYGEWSEIKDRYNGLNLKFRKGKPDANNYNVFNKERTYYMDVEVRAYNEGIAFRYHFPSTSNGLFIHITGEQTQFAMPEGTMSFYEKWAQGPISYIPINEWKDECERPLTMKMPNGYTVTLAEARLTDYVRTKFILDDRKSFTLKGSMYGCADIMTPYNTPWRVIMAADKAVDIINNNYIMLNLNDSCAIKDCSWIKPGKAFRTGLKQQEALAAVDFAVERGLQYIHLDAGWYGPEMKMSSDATTVSETKDLNIPAICKYAASKNIGVWLYVNQRALYQQIDTLLPLYKSWGVKGIKFGFVQVGNQQWTTWLHNAVRKCARYGMMVDIHDEYRPTGFSRTYPNLMTQEGVGGNEEFPNATHNVTLPFTRFIAGPADYTLCYFDKRIKTTHAHQLAMAIVYYSPIQFMYWYDKPMLYGGEKELELWKEIPTVWDETRALQGEPGEYIVTARRSGNDWYLGAMTGNKGREITIKTDFLQKGKKYMMTLYQDDASYPSKTKVKIIHKLIKGAKVIRLQLQESGGAAAHFRIM